MKKNLRQLSIIDAYVTDTPWGLDGGAYGPGVPPAPGSPTNDPHQLAIRVPTPEDAMLEMGAGQPPGIRIESGTHVHLTARKPQSTISLGATAGAGTKDMNPGINMATAGNYEKCVDNNEITEIKQDRTETVRGNEVVIVEKQRSHRVKGEEFLTVEKDRTVEVDQKYSLTSGERTETVNGSYTVNMPEHDYTVNASHAKLNSIHETTTLLGDKVRVTHGRESETTFGLKSSMFVGGNHSYVVGDKIEGTVAINMGVHAMKAEKIKLGISMRALSIEKIDRRLQNLGGKTTYVGPEGTELINAPAIIQSIGMFIVK